MKRIRYVEMKLVIVIPVYSHTAEEALAVADDQLEEVLSGYDNEDFLKRKYGDSVIHTDKPFSVQEDDLVWGDGVPEEHCTVGDLSLHLSK